MKSPMNWPSQIKSRISDPQKESSFVTFSGRQFNLTNVILTCNSISGKT